MKEFKPGDLIVMASSALLYNTYDSYPVKYCVIHSISDEDTAVIGEGNQHRVQVHLTPYINIVATLVPKGSIEYVLNYPDLKVEAEEE